VIPTAILAGLVLGLWVRWCAVAIVAVGWAVVIALVVDPSSALGGALLGAVNALVGVLPAVGLRKLCDRATQSRRDIDGRGRVGSS
jgi:integral membrane sensor domain MASE1